jgi:hypothetical protein
MTRDRSKFGTPAKHRLGDGLRIDPVVAPSDEVLDRAKSCIASVLHGYSPFGTISARLDGLFVEFDVVPRAQPGSENAGRHAPS